MHGQVRLRKKASHHHHQENDDECFGERARKERRQRRWRRKKDWLDGAADKISFDVCTDSVALSMCKDFNRVIFVYWVFSLSLSLCVSPNEFIFNIHQERKVWRTKTTMATTMILSIVNQAEWNLVFPKNEIERHTDQISHISLRVCLIQMTPSHLLFVIELERFLFAYLS